MSGVDLNTVRATAAEGWIYGHPMLENYRTMYAQAVDPNDSRYVGGFGTFRHYPQPSRPENTDIVTPNNDTPYSWCWLDLRAEPWVVSVPAMDRYYVLPFHDLDTTYVGFVGARTTGQDAGNHLIAGPGWAATYPTVWPGYCAPTPTSWAAWAAPPSPAWPTRTSRNYAPSRSSTCCGP